MDGDMNDIFQKLNTVLDDPNMSSNLKNILNNFSSQDNSSSSSESASKEEKTNAPDFDINTILNIKRIFDSVNSENNDARSNLLLSLKPYLADNKKEKVDQYIKFLRLAKIIEILNPIGGDSSNNV